MRWIRLLTHMLWMTASSIAVILGVLWITLESSDFLRPISAQVIGDEVSLIRLTPSGAVTARYRDDVLFVDQDEKLWQACETSLSGESIYQVTRSAVTFPIKAWFPPELCDVSRPGTYRVHSEWTVLLFGLLPLRPVVLEWEFTRP